MSKLRTTRIIMAMIATLMCGCASYTKTGAVYREWSARMSEMGIFPVYPPREDIVVGDVYALPLHPYDGATVGYIGGLGTAGIHVGYLGDTTLGYKSLLPKIESYYRLRPYPADTSTNGLPDDTNGPPPITRVESYTNAIESGRSNVFEGGSIARLRQVAFPEFSVTTIDQGALSAVVPIEAIMASFNFNYNNIQAVHFKIPEAESYGLTTEELLKEVYADNLVVIATNGYVYMDATTNGVISVGGAQMAHAMFKDIMKNIMSNLFPWYDLSPKDIMARRHFRNSVDQMTNDIYIALISEVYYARAIDITIDRKTAAAGSASAHPITAQELKQLKDWGLAKATTQTRTVTSTTDSTTNAPSTSQTNVAELSAGDDAFALAKKMQEFNTNAPKGINDIGGSVSVLHVTDNNIGLRRTFQRPVAVGVRGVLVKVDVNNPAQSTDTNVWMKIETDSAPLPRPTSEWITVVKFGVPPAKK